MCLINPLFTHKLSVHWCQWLFTFFAFYLLCFLCVCGPKNALCGIFQPGLAFKGHDSYCWLRCSFLLFFPFLFLRNQLSLLFLITVPFELGLSQGQAYKSDRGVCVGLPFLLLSLHAGNYRFCAPSTLVCTSLCVCVASRAQVAV